MMLLKLLSLVSVLVAVSGKRYCLEDGDCTDLGELFCIKSHCNDGVCSCPRGKAAKYIGSRKLYQCVPIKRVGEHCSNEGDDGVCGAAGAHCNESTKECTCNGGLVPVWGGERCAPEDSKFAGETCSPQGGIGQCSDGTMCSSPQSSAFWHNAVVMDVPTCACSNNQELYLVNWYGNPFKPSDIHSFPGKKQPTCVTRGIGDTCLRDTDCPSEGRCANSKQCVCTESTHVKDYYGHTCNKPLTFGEKCIDVANLPVGSSASDYGCDGGKGLVCGDMCALTNEENYPGNANATCTCGPFHSKSSTTCTLIGEGGSCYGDYNCKGWSPTGVCDEGKCVSDALRLVANTMISLLLPLGLTSKRLLTTL